MKIPQSVVGPSAIHEDTGLANSAEAAIAARNLANVFSFLATLLNECPDFAFVDKLRATGGDFIAGLGKESGFPEEVAAGFRDMAKYVEETKNEPKPTVQQDLAVDWTRVFRGVSPDYSPTPPYEACYADAMITEMQLIQTVNHLYLANGLMISSDYNNRPDYIGLEFSFLAHLAEAEAQAWDEDNAELAESYQETGRAFLREHLGWVEKYVTRAMDYAKTGFYRGFLRLCRGVVAEAAG